jgi:hypothetical protein
MVMWPYTDEESNWLSRSISDYVSVMVFDGTRTIVGTRLARLKAKRERELLSQQHQQEE